MTTTLLTYAGPADADAPATRTGGVPLVPEGFRWPHCAECSGPMKFLAHLLFGGSGEAERALSVFQCHNDPGLCEEWDPAAGGNRALAFPTEGLAASPVPAGGTPLLPETCAIGCVPADAPYGEARTRWSAAHGRPLRDVLGQLGGAPRLQGDETSDCTACGQPMAFVAHLEEGRSHETAANFGGGCGYAFACTPCSEGAFLWQC